MTTVLITGANRGLGLGLTKSYVSDGNTVFACCRSPKEAPDLQALAASDKNVQLLRLDVTGEQSVEALKNELGQTPIDILINNAGILIDRQSFEDMDFGGWEESFRVNSIGPFRIVQALIDNLRAGADKKAITISSEMGSVGGVYYGGSFAYSSSKSAANMVTKILSNRLKQDGVICIPIHPGWVQTDMGGSGASISVDESVKGLRQVIDKLTLADTGRYFQWDGQELEW